MEIDASDCKGTSDLAEQIRLACVLEATARKPGNVHPEAAFADLTWRDFVISAEAAAPILARTCELGVGQAIRNAVAATRKVVRTNTNLGIILLIAPLAAVPRDVRLPDGIAGVLARLTQRDAELVYEAIRLAQPGAMGKVKEQDVSEPPTKSLVEVMRLAADRDLIARQYAEDFNLVLGMGMLHLARSTEFAIHWERAIIGLQLNIMSRYPDSLILRKCGPEIAAEASLRAGDVLQAVQPGAPYSERELAGFDRWLRADLNRRNPGTTADLIAASLFAAFREGVVPRPIFDESSKIIAT
jgi:triphosphoribosyl-dephospho-CoA synthase